MCVRSGARLQPRSSTKDLGESRRDPAAGRSRCGRTVRRLPPRPVCEGQTVANLYFLEGIAAGEHGSACSFTVAGSDNFPVEIDLADSLSDLEGDDTQ